MLRSRRSYKVTTINGFERGDSMVKAYVFITTSDEDQTMEKVRAIPGVKEAHIVYGTYNILLIVEAKTSRELKELITKAIRHIDGILNTMTTIVL
ncbi:MAG: Lrp/AsnC family transcriptional regulator [Methanobacteriota archaeon]|nr:MAG: Lrp/AsnC family transcriptional regulator [Euryarchaeota archaeon]